METSAEPGSTLPLAPSPAPSGDGASASPSAVETLRAELDALREAVERNHREIDDLQVRTAETHRPWYRHSQTLVAVFALLLSLLTTLTSAYWAKTQGDVAEVRLRQQEIHDARTELRGLLQAMASLTRQVQEVPVMGDGGVTQVLLTSYASEIALLTNQAYQVAESIPGQVTSNEYLTIAVRMGEMGDFEKADTLMQQAIATAETPFDILSAKRTYALYLFSQNRFEQGRQYLEEVLDVWTIYTDAGQLVPVWQPVEDFVTYMRWAEAETGVGHCAEADTRRDLADDLRLQLGLVPGSSLQQQFDWMAMLVDSCQPNVTIDLPAFPAFPAVPPEDLAPFDPLFPLQTPLAGEWWLAPIETPVLLPTPAPLS